MIWRVGKNVLKKFWRLKMYELGKFLEFIYIKWLLAMPLALWKVIDIAIWLIQHFRVNII